MLEFGKEIEKRLRASIGNYITDVDENAEMGGTVISIDHRIKVAIWEEGHWMGVAVCDTALTAHVKLRRTQDFDELLSTLLEARLMDLDHVVDKMVALVSGDEGPQTLH